MSQPTKPHATAHPSSRMSLPRWAVWAMGGALAASVFANGIALGRMTSGPIAQASTAHVGSTRGTSPSATPTKPTFISHVTVGQLFNWHVAVRNTQNHADPLVRGPNGTIIMPMASWCLFCGYTDRWTLPQLAKIPGIAVDIVDVSPQGGIANPGPETPPFHGQDGTGGPLTTAEMGRTMTQYRKAYQGLPGIHVRVAPQTTQALWNVQSYPVLIWVNKQGVVSQITSGGLTVSQAEQIMQSAFNTPS